MSFTSFEFIVPSAYDGKSVKDFLRKYAALSSRSLILSKYNAFGIIRNGEQLKTIDRVYENDIITVTLPNEQNDIIPVEGALDILYEDDRLLLINKPPFMPVHPTKKHQEDTLANIVSFYQRQQGESYTFRALNRLDKDTSGIVMIVKDRIAYGILSGKVSKEYTAVCEGVIEESGTIDMPIALKEGSKIIRETSSGGLSAVTHYQPIRSNGYHTLLNVVLETGRTHQIRCHLSAIGHPLAGDDLYGGSRKLISRQALHLRKMSFHHPFTGEELIIETPIPEEFLNIFNL